MPGGVECFYEFNLLHHVVLVAKRVRAAAETAAAHEGDDNTPSGGRGKNLTDMDLSKSNNSNI